MKKISVLWVAMVVALVVLSCAAPQTHGASTSPVATPWELTPPYRPTPTGWRNGTPPPTAERERKEMPVMVLAIATPTTAAVPEARAVRMVEVKRGR